MYADAKKPVPHYIAYTKCLFQGCSMCYPAQEGVASRKRPQTTWRRTSPLCTISTLQETNNLFPKEMKNVMTPRVQKVPMIMKRTTVLLIQNYYWHFPKSHGPSCPKKSTGNLDQCPCPQHIVRHFGPFQEGPKYSTLKRMGKLNWEWCATWNNLKGR